MGMWPEALVVVALQDVERQEGRASQPILTQSPVILLGGGRTVGFVQAYTKHYTLVYCDMRSCVSPWGLVSRGRFELPTCGLGSLLTVGPI